MIHLFTHVPVTQKLVRPAQLPTLLRDYQVDGASGVLWFGGPDNSQIVMLLVEGMIIHISHLTRESREPLELSQLSALLPSRNGIVRTAWLPAEGVRIAKAILDWHPPVETKACETHDLPALIQAWGTAPGSSIMRITWTDAESFVLLTGQLPPEITLYASKGKLFTGEIALEALQQHADTPCTAAWYRAPQLPVLAEASIAPLRAAFATMLVHLWENYTRLVGTGLTQVLLAELERKALGNGWHMEFSLTAVKDLNMFSSLTAAVTVYRQIMQETTQHIAMVIGTQMAHDLIEDTVANLLGKARATLQAHEILSLAVLPTATALGSPKTEKPN